ncbi:MAG: MFS transporter [Bacilli bacterium]|nr:MFS transporter [Bacilli bacterium]
MDGKKYVARNLWMYPLGTIGRDMMYQLFSSFMWTFILLTKGLTAGQIAAVTGIMIGARIFDAFNDPIMGVIIEKTKTRWGKFKPWLAIGMILTVGVIITTFAVDVTGWAFVGLFGAMYFAYSITYTMHDISYWGMIPALSSNPGTRDKYSSRAVLFAGIGSTLAGMLIPMLTVGDGAIGGSTKSGYAWVAVGISVLSLIFICFTIFGVKEVQEDEVKDSSTLVTNKKEAQPVKKDNNGIKKMIKVIAKNKPLLWIIVAFLLQQIGNGLITSGIGSTYIYFQYGFNGGNYSLFSTIGVAATAVLMVLYPTISRNVPRKKLMTILLIVGLIGYAIMGLCTVHFLPLNIEFWVLTAGFTLSNFGQYGFYLVMMISILNTVEYNEYISGERDEAVIASVRPFITKLASALIAGITSLSYIIFRVNDVTKGMNELETAHTTGTITDVEFSDGMTTLIGSIQDGQKLGLLLVVIVIPCLLLVLSYFVYKKKYILDEEKYNEICAELRARKHSSN